MIKKILGFVVCIGLATSNAIADSASNMDSYRTDGAPYITLGGGYGANSQNFFSDRAGGFTWRPAVGYIKHEKKWAYGAEVAYTGYQTQTSTFLGNSVKSEVASVDFLLVGKYFFAPRFNVLLKAGASNIMSRLTATEAGQSRSASQNQIAPTAGIGVGYFVTKNIALGLEMQTSYWRVTTHSTSGRSETSDIWAGSTLFNVQYYF
jgi:opacity protein-like surface antigen